MSGLSESGTLPSANAIIDGLGGSSSSHSDSHESPSPRSSEDHASPASAPPSTQAVVSRPAHVIIDMSSTEDGDGDVSSEGYPTTRYKRTHFETRSPRRRAPARERCIAEILNRLGAKEKRRGSLVGSGSLASSVRRNSPLLLEEDVEPPPQGRTASMPPVSTEFHPKDFNQDGKVNAEDDELALAAMFKLGESALSSAEIRALATTREGAKAMAGLLVPRPEAEVKSEAKKTTGKDVAATGTGTITIMTIATTINEKCNPDGKIEWTGLIYGIAFLLFLIGLFFKNKLLNPKREDPSKIVANALTNEVAKEEAELPGHKTVEQVEELIQFLGPKIVESLAGKEEGV